MVLTEADGPSEDNKRAVPRWQDRPFASYVAILLRICRQTRPRLRGRLRS